MQVDNNEIYNSDRQLAKSIGICLSNICASTEQNVEKIICNKQISKLIFEIYDKFEDKVKYEFLFMFHNAFVRGSNYARAEIMRMDVIKIFSECLVKVNGSMSKSNTILVLILNSFKVFLDWGEKTNSKMNVVKCEIENCDQILDIIDQLQFNSNPEIYELANFIYINYWGENELMYQDASEFLKMI
jgi:hypothetical protein